MEFLSFGDLTYIFSYSFYVSLPIRMCYETLLSCIINFVIESARKIGDTKNEACLSSRFWFLIMKLICIMYLCVYLLFFNVVIQNKVLFF